MLSIKNLKVKTTSGIEVLKGLNLEINVGEIHAIMGPNGAGKSTLSKVISGHPDYIVTDGVIEYEVNLKKKNILKMEPNERAQLGIFVSFQYPIEIPGISNQEFLKTAYNSICEGQGIKTLDSFDFNKLIKEKIKLLGIHDSFLNRDINVDFSGGEKKRNEILQMAILSPRLAFLDETDSGLDVDALRLVAAGINTLKNKGNAFVLITHYSRLLEYVVPDYVHILNQGRITKTGDNSLAMNIEEKGYDW